MGNRKYIEAQEFNDFKKNQEIWIETFNHNFTDLKKDFTATNTNVEKIALCLAEIKGNLKVTGKIVWWILGIMATLIIAGCLSMVAGV